MPSSAASPSTAAAAAALASPSASGQQQPFVAPSEHGEREHEQVSTEIGGDAGAHDQHHDHENLAVHPGDVNLVA